MRFAYFAVDGDHQQGPDVRIFQMTTGARILFIVGFYLYPTNVSTIERAVKAMGHRPLGAKLMVVGDLNTYLVETYGNGQEEEIVTVLAG